MASKLTQEREKGQEPGRIEQEWVDGLPPVGVECEGYPDERSGFERCLVVWHDPDPEIDDHPTLALFEDGGKYCEPLWCTEFRPLKSQHERQRDELAHRDNETERLRARVTELEGILYNANLQTDRLKRDYVTHKQAEAVVPAIMKAVEDFGHPDTTYSAARVYAEEYARDLTMKRRKR